MVTVRKPKDLAMAEAVYNEVRPEVPFDDLNHEAQMRWVRAARAAVGDYKRQAPPAVKPPPLDVTLNGSSSKRRGGFKVGMRFKTDEEKLSGYDKADTADRSLLKNLDPADKRAADLRAKMLWRDRQREKMGKPTQNDDMRRR